MTAIAAVDAGFIACQVCHLLNKQPRAGQYPACFRCGASLHPRKPDSIARTWALVITACILYVPANVLPVMETGSLFGSQSDTIMSGVVFLWTSGSWPLAVIVFVASILVPGAKLAALIVLLISVQNRSSWRTVDRSRLYRMLALVGRWSMVDIYVAAILTGLAHFQSLATIHAGPGAIAFGAVIVLTMFAAEAFDPRLIWDPLRRRHAAYSG
jgi:paraquat-inducible protein A